MFNNVVLDVCIGLIFIYLLYSLLASTINEFIAMIFAYRHRMLEKSIEQMLDGRNISYYWWDKLANILIRILRVVKAEKLNKIRGSNKGLKKKKSFVKGNNLSFLKTYRYHNNIIKINKTAFKRVKVNKKAALFAAHIINHPLYRRKSEQSILYKKPAYLTASAFSDILFDVLSSRRSQNNATPVLMNDIKQFVSSQLVNNPDLKSILNMFIEQANGDVQKFKLLIEDWFDDTMNRVSGWYKRQATKVLFAIGLVLAFAFNVSTIEIVDKLSVNKDIRETLAKSASAYVENANRASTPAEDKKAQLSSDSVLEKAKTQIKNIKTLYNDTIAELNTMMGLGWGDFGYSEKYTPIVLSERKNDSIYKWNYIHNLPVSKSNRIIYFKHYRTFFWIFQVHTTTDTFLLPAKSQNLETKFKAHLDSKHKLNGRATISEMVSYVLKHVTLRDLLGFIITALAITLGAPFWFDLLNKFVNVRAGGNKPVEDKGLPISATVSKTVTLNQKPDPKSFA